MIIFAKCFDTFNIYFPVVVAWCGALCFWWAPQFWVVKTLCLITAPPLIVTQKLCWWILHLFAPPKPRLILHMLLQHIQFFYFTSAGKRLIQSDVDVFIAKMLYDFWQKIIVYYKYELSSFRYQIPDNRSGCTASALCPNDTAAVLQLLDCAGRWYIAGSRHLRGPSLSLTFFVDKFKYWVPLTITIHHLSSCCPALPSGVNVAINLGKCQNIAILW